MWAGTRRLLQLEVPTPIPQLSRRLSNQVKLGLTRYPYSNVPGPARGLRRGRRSTPSSTDAGGPAWDDDGYARLREPARAELTGRTVEVVTAVEQVGRGRARRPDARWPAPATPALAAGRRGHAGPAVRADPAGLRHRGRRAPPAPTCRATCRRSAGGWRSCRPTRPATATGWTRWPRCGPSTTTCSPRCRRTAATSRTCVEIRWMIEELRVSLFAQDLRTRYPVSRRPPPTRDGRHRLTPCSRVPRVGDACEPTIQALRRSAMARCPCMPR